MTPGFKSLASSLAEWAPEEPIYVKLVGNEIDWCCTCEAWAKGTPPKPIERHGNKMVCPYCGSARGPLLLS